jgi:hypothetical protein
VSGVHSDRLKLNTMLDRPNSNSRFPHKELKVHLPFTPSFSEPVTHSRPLAVFAAVVALTLTAGCGLFGSDGSDDDPPGDDGSAGGRVPR